MTCRLVAVCIDAHDPPLLAGFWASLLGRPIEGGAVVPVDGIGFPLRFAPTQEPKSAKNWTHLDLTSASSEDQQRTVARALELGGRHIDIGQRPEEGHVVLADPEGNEFCVIEAGNAFLAGCGFVGALACDGSRQVGEFWSAALRWPLVWDQGEETAIQSPQGGPKITWGGPPFSPGSRLDRLRFDVAVGGAADVDRLVSLGARPVEMEGGQGVMADPDGRPFHVHPAA